MASKTGILLTLPIETILRIQQTAVEMLLQGRVMMSWEGEGTSAKKEFAMPIVDILSECDWALRSLDPDTYGPIRIQIKTFHS